MQIILIVNEPKEQHALGNYTNIIYIYIIYIYIFKNLLLILINIYIVVIFKHYLKILNQMITVMARKKLIDETKLVARLNLRVVLRSLRNVQAVVLRSI